MSSDASLPLALNLRSQVTLNIFTNERWKPGEKYEEKKSLTDFAFLDSVGGRFKSTLLFASIVRAFYEHPDWSQLHAFFSKRYGPAQAFMDREARKLSPPDDDSYYKRDKKVIANFKTDPSSVGLPKDLASQLATAGRTVRSRMLGPDPQPAAIGPAISIAIGAGAYMDLVYAGHKPGEYPERHRIGSKLFGWKKDKFQAVTGDMATTKKGGRDRSWAEWAELWSLVAEWVYEHESTSLEHLFINMHSYKYRLSDEERRSIPIGSKVPRKYLATDGIDAADAVRDVFEQLSDKPGKFQGIEWDFLELGVEQEVREEFYSRFGRKDPDERKSIEALVRPIGMHGWNRLDYNEVSPVALKQCPETFNGLDWETWMLAIEGGDVVVVNTLFQALWAMILLSQLPLKIKIVNKEDKFPRYRDSDTVYL